MTYQEQQEMKARLIDLGFWGATELGDPTANNHDASTLNLRLEAKLAKDVFLVSTPTTSHSLTRQVMVFHGNHIYPIATADNYPEAICLAALALPEFLKQHPEYAAVDLKPGP
jgi:hypothetical protein